MKRQKLHTFCIIPAKVVRDGSNWAVGPPFMEKNRKIEGFGDIQVGF